MTIHCKSSFRKIRAQPREIHCLYPGSRHNDVRRSRFRQPRAQLLGIDNRPDIRLNAPGAHALSSIERRYTQSDMAHRAVGGEVFVSEYDLHLPKRYSAKLVWVPGKICRVLKISRKYFCEICDRLAELSGTFTRGTDLFLFSIQRVGKFAGDHAGEAMVSEYQEIRCH